MRSSGGTFPDTGKCDPVEYTTQLLTQQEVYVVRLDAIRLTRRVRYLACGLAAGALAGGTLAVASIAPASAATSCQVAYSVNQWNTGFTASVTITNEGSALTSWTLTYSYSGNQQLTQGWSGNWTQSGENVTVTNASWNGSLATGAATQIGANFSYSGTNTAPTAFSINGTACNGGGVTSSPTPTTQPHQLTDAHPDANADADLDGQRAGPATARVRQQAGQRERADGAAARGGPVRYRVRVRAGQWHLRRPQ